MVSILVFGGELIFYYLYCTISKRKPAAAQAYGKGASIPKSKYSLFQSKLSLSSSLNPGIKIQSIPVKTLSLSLVFSPSRDQNTVYSSQNSLSCRGVIGCLSTHTMVHVFRVGGYIIYCALHMRCASWQERRTSFFDRFVARI